MLGKPAPEFRLAASNGSDVSLKDALSKSKIILFFVREYN